MVGFHETLGSLIVIVFLALIVVNVLRAIGRTIGFARPLSAVASALLFLQYVWGFALLGGDHEITAWHYLVALLAIVPVGVEHAIANTKTDSRAAGRVGAIANGATFVLVLVAYMIGINNS